MVSSVTSFSRNGLRDWIIQRVSAVILASYVLFLLAYLVLHTPLAFTDWYTLFQSSWMSIFSALTLLSLLAHSWIGMWTIGTDYLNCTYLRFTYQVFVILALIACFIWGIQIVWSV